MVVVILKVAIIKHCKHLPKYLAIILHSTQLIMFVLPPFHIKRTEVSFVEDDLDACSASSRENVQQVVERRQYLEVDEKNL